MSEKSSQVKKKSKERKTLTLFSSFIPYNVIHSFAGNSFQLSQASVDQELTVTFNADSTR